MHEHPPALVLPPAHGFFAEDRVNAARGSPENHFSPVQSRKAALHRAQGEGTAAHLGVGQEGQLVPVHLQSHGRVATEVLVGHEEDLLVLLASPAHHFVCVGAGANRAAGAPGQSFQAPRGVHVGHYQDLVAVALDQLVSYGQDHVVLRQHLHGATGLGVGDPDALVFVRQDSHRFGHEMHGRLHDDLLFPVLRGLQGESVGVPHGPAVALDEFDDLATHVVVRQEQQRVPKVFERRLQVAIQPGQHGLRSAVLESQVLFGVGLELSAVPTEGQVGLADRHARLEFEPLGVFGDGLLGDG